MHSVYQHLPQGCIRLLTLHPDDASAKLLCTLQSTSLESAPEYEAVSYAWGDPKVSQIPSPSRPAQTRKTYQAVVSITPNVTSLLQSLRRADGPRVLWIDAICINQVDISERNVQVQQMRSIYTRAIRTVIWLGTATEDGTSDLALAFLSKMAAYQRYLHWTRSEVSFYEEGDEDYAFESDANSFDNHSAQGGHQLSEMVPSLRLILRKPRCLTKTRTPVQGEQNTPGYTCRGLFCQGTGFENG